MLYRIVYLDSALLDYIAIIRYASQFYPSTPLKFKNALRKQLDSVRFNPRCCPRVEEFPQFRKLHVNQYLVFYTFDVAARQVVVHRIYHGSQNIQCRLKEYIDNDLI